MYMHQRIERHVAATNFFELVGAVSAQHGCLLSRGANKDEISVSVSFCNYIHNYFMIILMKFIILKVNIFFISKRNPSMIKALLCFIDKDKKELQEIIDSLKIVVQKFKTCEGKILRLEQIEQFCISKNMALILYVLRMRPCF